MTKTPTDIAPSDMEHAPPARRPRRLPGDPSSKDETERMIRVDQAGEYGAARIYAGQLSVLGRHEIAKTLQHMADQEKVHLDAFNKLAPERKVRPTALTPIWHAAGYALGAGTAAMGEKAAMACTVAVEEVIDEHYAAQADALGTRDDTLKSMIEKFREEELEHRDIGYEHGAEDAPAFPLLSQVIKRASRLAIYLSERF